jgi:hypothetical protein
MRVVGHVAHKGDMKNMCKISVWNSEGKGPLVRHRRRWEDNIKIDLKGNRL